ncbi:hypothetical protein [Mesorhizobium shangrilense]|uniref:hypothetical protein n=1 Tax=Mesorhizobium shangrilense TaxID=460060 RepID=UPI003396C972
MGNRYSDNEALFAELHSLIDSWCDRRCLRPLGIVLPAYNAFNGMTDGWGDLLTALRALALVRDALLPDEQEIVMSLRRAAEDAVEAR